MVCGFPVLPAAVIAVWDNCPIIWEFLVGKVCASGWGGSLRRRGNPGSGAAQRRRCWEENPTGSLPAVHISAGFRQYLSSNLPSTSLSHSRDFEQKKWPQPSLLSWPLLLLPLPSPRFLPVLNWVEIVIFCEKIWILTFSGRLVLDSLHRPVCSLWSRECQTRAQPCLAALASSPSSTTGRPTSSAPTQTRPLPGETFFWEMRKCDKSDGLWGWFDDIIMCRCATAVDSNNEVVTNGWAFSSYVIIALLLTIIIIIICNHHHQSSSASDKK